MVVAMRAVRVMQMAVHEKIGVVAVWNSLVAAVHSVLVTIAVSVALVLRCAVVWIVAPDGDAMFIDMVVVDVM
jgi:hypothetical protein